MNDPRVGSIYYSAVIELGPVRGRRRPSAHGGPRSPRRRGAQVRINVSPCQYRRGFKCVLSEVLRRRLPPHAAEVYFYCVLTSSNTRPTQCQSEEIKVRSVHAYISFIIRPRRTPPLVVGFLRCRDIGSARIRRNIALVGEFSGARDGRQNVD